MGAAFGLLSPGTPAPQPNGQHNNADDGTDLPAAPRRVRVPLPAASPPVGPAQALASHRVHVRHRLQPPTALVLTALALQTPGSRPPIGQRVLDPLKGPPPVLGSRQQQFSSGLILGPLYGPRQPDVGVSRRLFVHPVLTRSPS